MTVHNKDGKYPTNETLHQTPCHAGAIQFTVQCTLISMGFHQPAMISLLKTLFILMRVYQHWSIED